MPTQRGPDLDSALAAVPATLRKRLVANYSTVKSIGFRNQHDTVGHQVGKLAEVLLRVLQHTLTGTFIPLTGSVGSFTSECEKLQNTPKTSGPEGLRLLMPRALLFLYSLRNKRDFGHVGGEVDANEIDSLTATRLADWCMCELVRVAQGIPIEDAQAICDAIATRTIPTVWNVLGRKRILVTGLSYKEQTLLLLYSDLGIAVATEDLLAWTEHSHSTNYRRDVLTKLHSERLIEWDKDTEMALLSPTGIAEVERKIMPKLPVGYQ